MVLHNTTAWLAAAAAVPMFLMTRGAGVSCALRWEALQLRPGLLSHRPGRHRRRAHWRPMTR